MAIPKKPGGRVRVKPVASKPAVEIPPPMSSPSEARKENPAQPKSAPTPVAARAQNGQPAAGVKVSSSATPVITEEAIRAKAHELWKARGCRNGHADQDWADAIVILKAEAARKAQPKTVAPATEPTLKLVRVA